MIRNLRYSSTKAKFLKEIEKKVKPGAFLEVKKSFSGLRLGQIIFVVSEPNVINTKSFSVDVLIKTSKQKLTIDRSILRECLKLLSP